MKKWNKAALILSLALAGSAHATGYHWDKPGTGYVELGGGIANYENYCHDINGLASNIASSLSSLSGTSSKMTQANCDRSGSGFKATLGAHITRHVFGEMFYMSYGTSNSHLEYESSNSTAKTSTQLSITLRGYAYGGEIGWLQTYGPVGFYLKGGEAIAKLESKAYATSTNTGGGSGTYSSSQAEGHDRKYAPIASIGGVVHIWKGFSVTVNYDRLFNVGSSSTTPQTDISLYTAGLRYAF